MDVEKKYAAVDHYGRLYAGRIFAKIVPGEAQQWYVEIRREGSDGAFSMVYNESFSTLHKALRGLKEWRKWLRWVVQNG